jgi:hypothetical protein
MLSNRCAIHKPVRSSDPAGVSRFHLGRFPSAICSRAAWFSGLFARYLHAFLGEAPIAIMVEDGTAALLRQPAPHWPSVDR